VTDGLADTSVFIAAESGRPLDLDRLPDRLAISIITVGELRAGVLAASGPEVLNRRLSTLAGALALQPIPIDEAVAESWALLRIRLREARLRMPVNDSWIAATAMSRGIPIVTRDDDYVEVAGLDVIHV
jgi:predicted nucleic acid-binding protein